MNYKEIFQNSLNDEQLGFFYAREFDDELAELLKDELTGKQYRLFEEWKENEAKTVPAQLDTVAVEILFQKMTNIVNALSDRLGKLEMKMDNLHYSQKAVNEDVDSQARITELVDKIEKLEKSSAENTSNMQKEIEELKGNTAKVVEEEIKKVKETTANEIKQATEQNSDRRCTSLWLSSVSEKHAKTWIKDLFEQINGCSTDEKKAQIGTEKIIQTVTELMKKFEPSEESDSKWPLKKKSECNDEIESICCATLYALADSSAKSCKNIVDAGCISHLCDIFTRNWQRRNDKQLLLNNVSWIFTRISYHSSARLSLLEDKILYLILVPILSDEFTKFDIFSLNILLTLLKIPDQQWKCTKSKEAIEDHIFKGMKKFVIGKYNPILNTGYSPTLKLIQSGSKAERQFYTWMIANQVEFNPERSCAMLKKEGAVPILEELLADSKTDLEVKKLLVHILKKLKN